MTMAIKPNESIKMQNFEKEINKLKDSATFESMGLELTDTKKDEIAQLFSIDPTKIEDLNLKDLSYLNRLKRGRYKSLNELLDYGYEPHISASLLGVTKRIIS